MQTSAVKEQHPHGDFWSTDTFSIDDLNHRGHETPYFLFSLEKIRENHRRLQSALPHCALHYAVKANSIHRVLETLAHAGSKFDIGSANELNKLAHFGVEPHQILYSTPVKPRRDVTDAWAQGVCRFTVDSRAEVHKLAEIAPGAAVYLRLAVDDHESTFPLSTKFGASATEGIELMHLAASEGLVPYGVTFHVGSQSTTTQPWRDAIQLAGTVLDDLAKQGLRIEALNIGGGFPVRYSAAVPDIETVGTVVQEAVDEFVPFPVKLEAEPGRVIVADAGVLCATVIGKEERRGKRWVYLDVGAFNGLMEVLETPSPHHYPLSTSLECPGPLVSCNVTGPTCDQGDTLFKDIGLPENVNVDDRVYIGVSGAYSIEYASHFNGFGPPHVLYLED